jgi:hypothetical protein
LLTNATNPLALCEVERLLLAHVLDRTPTPDARCAYAMQVLRNKIGVLGFSTAFLHRLDPDLGGPAVMAIEQWDTRAAAARARAAGRPVGAPTIRPWLPFPLLGDVASIREEWKAHLGLDFAAGPFEHMVVEACATSGEAESGPATGAPRGTTIMVSADERNLIAEALLISGGSPHGRPRSVQEMQLVASILAQVGFPWLPPALGTAPVHQIPAAIELFLASLAGPAASEPAGAGVMPG